MPDFCPGSPWPKVAPGPPPISNPVMHSTNRPNSPVRAIAPSLVDGPTKGVSESMLLVKYAADKQQGEMSILLKAGLNPNVMHKVCDRPRGRLHPQLPVFFWMHPPPFADCAP